MAGSSGDRTPLRTVIAPALGVLVWLVVGKTGLGLVALVVAVVLLANVMAAVHHAEVIAVRVGEPYGTLVLALSVTVIEAGLIVSMMLAGEPNPALMRDSVHAVVILVLHGLAGLCIVVGAIRYRQSEFQVEGANAFLAVLIPMAVLVLVAPTYMVSVPGPYYSPIQLAFVSLACFGLYLAFLFIQTNWHRDFFLPVGGEAELSAHARPSSRRASVSFGLLLVALFSVVMLAKSLAPALDEAIVALGAPSALNGVIVAAIVLMPESVSAVRAAAANRLQSSINLALGSAIASIALTVPVVALVTWWVGQPLTLGIEPGAAVLMMLGFLVAMITYGTGRTNLLSGVVHLVLLATYVFSIFAP
jgi:Ca2+:H+ antiporter